MEYYDDKVHEVAQIIADKTEHYTQFHRGLDSVSADKIRQAAKAVIEYLQPHPDCRYKVGDRILVVSDCNAFGGRVYVNDGKEFVITKILTPLERFGCNYRFNYVLECDGDWFRDCDVTLVADPEPATAEDKHGDTTYLFYKETGKWKYEGRGWFPETFDVNRETIMEANGGQMPGISSSGNDYMIVVVPDDDCDSMYAYPRMIKPV